MACGLNNAGNGETKIGVTVLKNVLNYKIPLFLQDSCVIMQFDSVQNKN